MAELWKGVEMWDGCSFYVNLQGTLTVTYYTVVSVRDVAFFGCQHTAVDKGHVLSSKNAYTMGVTTHDSLLLYCL